MRIFFSEHQLAHAPQQFMVAGRIVKAVEVPERAINMRDRLVSAGLEAREPSDFGRLAMASVHPDHYLDFLETAWQRFQELPQAGPEVLANVHPHHAGAPSLARRPPPRPTGIVGLAGWYMGDLACAIGEGSWSAAYWAAQGAIAAAEDVVSGTHHAYALCRPPGHHAYADRASGFCFLNNAAIAAEVLRRTFDRVAIVDFDTHHGDGTQSLFYGRADVLYCSTHTDPAVYYPYFAGYADETGTGEGEGCTLNLPLPVGTGDDAFIAANRAMADAVRGYRADAIVLSAGWDAHKDDPLSRLDISTAAFAELGTIWGGFSQPVVIVQEGGYSLSAIQEIAPTFIRAFLKARGGTAG